MMSRHHVVVILVALAVATTSVHAQPGTSCYNCVRNQSTGCWDCLDGYRSGGTHCPVVYCESCTVSGTCGTGSSGCFVGDVAIATLDGDKLIRSLEVGDTVLSRTASGSLIRGVVSDTHLVESDSYLEINGKLKVTAGHPFFANGRWITAGELSIGDELATLSGQDVVVASIEKIYKGVRAYNISVDGCQTFFADGFLVHNKPPKLDS